MDGDRARRGHGELEAEVLAAVSGPPEAMTVRDIRQAVDPSLSYPAVHAILRRLVAKNLVERRTTAEGQVYRPAEDAANTVARQMNAMLRRGPGRAAVLRSFLSILSATDERYLRERLARPPSTSPDADGSNHRDAPDVHRRGDARDHTDDAP